MKNVREPLRLALLCALLFAATLALYRPALGFGFVDYDDPDFVTENPDVLNGFSLGSVRWAFASGGNAANWQPLAWLSLMLDAQLWGESPAGFHLTNILWHSASAALAFLLLCELTGAPLLSFWAAALFAWHPLRVESVAWIAERKDVMSVFFGLLTLYAWARALKACESDHRFRRWYVAALVAYALGLLCKAMLVTLPAILFLVSLTVQNTRGVSTALITPRRVVSFLIPFGILAFGSAAITFQIQHAAGATSDAFPLSHRLANALLTIPRYLGDFVWPTKLAIGYPHDRSILFTSLIAAFGLLALVSLVVLRLAARHPWAMAGWCWFVIMLLPVLGVLQVGAQARADRYTYLPSLGLELVAIAALLAIPSRPLLRWTGAAVGIAVLVFAGVRTRQQLPVWSDSTALFTHALAVAPNNYIALAGRATTLMNSGRTAEAAWHVARALEAMPDYVPALLVAGALEESAGHSAAAVARYKTAARLAPRFAPAHERLGTVLLHAQRFDEALAEFDLALRIRSDAPAAALGRALALVHLNCPSDAASAFSSTIALRPNYAEAHAAFANLLDANHDPEAAWFHYEAALHARPRYPLTHYNYANSLLRHGQPALAVLHYRAAANLDPTDPDAAYGLASAFEQVGRGSDAIAGYEATLRLSPTHAEAHYNLGVLLLAQERAAEAAAHFRAATAAQPSFGEAFVGLGLAEAAEGQMADAIRDGRTAVGLMPAHAAAHYSLGQTLLRAGRSDDAVREWREALRLTPDFPGLKELLSSVAASRAP